MTSNADYGAEDGPLTDEIARLRAALADAIEGMEDMIGYVSKYFREKWEHDAYIARAKKALSPNDGSGA